MTPILHIEHPEDSILTGDLSFLDAIKNRGVLSVKMDGAPAIVWGVNPASGKFFVGTKSVFNKVKIKINESHQDIDANHSGVVADILHKCFDYLPDPKGGIFQGDFIGFGGYSEYTPNTITYKFDDVVTEEIIIAPHTYYTTSGDNLRDAIAHPMTFTITNNFYCRFVTPRAYIWSGSYNELGTEFELPPAMTAILSLLPTVQFVNDKEAAQIRKNVNTALRTSNALRVEDFNGNVSLMHLYGLVQFVKEECLAQCRVLNGPEAYIGQDRISGEGYVYSYEGKVYKFVNRKVFSVANFENTKFDKLAVI